MNDQSPTLASQATAELPKLPEPKQHAPIYPDESREDQYAAARYVTGWNDCHAAFTRYLAGVEAGRASRAQSEGAEIVTQADVNRARELILDATSTDLLSGDRKVRKADRAIVYGWLCEAANVLVGEVPATLGETK